MFKKVIGQEASAPQKPSLTANQDSGSQGSTTGTARDSAGYGSTGATSGSVIGTRNVLSSDVEIKGVVKFQHDLIVDGKIEGEIQSSGNLTVGENARIKAEIKTGTVVVYGKVHGNITAVERIELKASAEVIGDIKAKSLTIEGGAIFVGKSTVGTPTEAQTASASNSNQKASPEVSPDQPVLAIK